MEKEKVIQFREAFRKFEREIFYMNNESCCKQVTLSQCYTLVEIDKHKSLSVKELANSLSLDKSTVSRTVDGLVNSGLVERITPPENRRTTLLNLTSEGSETCGTINAESDRHIIENLSVLSEEEQNIFIDLLKKVTHKMRKSRKQCI